MAPHDERGLPIGRSARWPGQPASHWPPQGRHEGLSVSGGSESPAKATQGRRSRRGGSRLLARLEVMPTAASNSYQSASGKPGTVQELRPWLLEFAFMPLTTWGLIAVAGR